jgi:hypothetical protein
MNGFQDFLFYQKCAQNVRDLIGMNKSKLINSNRILEILEILRNLDIDWTIHAHPNKFKWLGKSERRHTDFIDGYQYALNTIEEWLSEEYKSKTCHGG